MNTENTNPDSGREKDETDLTGADDALSADGHESADSAETGSGSRNPFDYSISVIGNAGPEQERLFGDIADAVDGEPIRKLRTELLVRHGYGNAAPLALAVISPNLNEGRTLLAAELAASFSLLGRSTLLIDADFRSPRVAGLEGSSPENGLAQSLMTGNAPELRRIERFPNLTVLPAGSPGDINPTELLSTMAFRRLIDSMKNLFDFVVVDTPPFSRFSDAQIVSAVVGRVLTVHRTRISTYKEVRTMLRALATSQTQVMGGVLNNH